jgi:hypothetical protein
MVDVMEAGVEGGSWTKMTEDLVEWRVLVLAVLSHGFSCQSVTHYNDETPPPPDWHG